MNLRRKNAQAGGSLVAVLVLGAVMSASIVYYLSLVEQQAFLSMRSQSWNMAISVAEAGIEEGLQHLNSNESALGTDGWSQTGSIYKRTNSLPDGSGYEVDIIMTNPATPMLICRSYLKPYQLTGLAQAAAFAAVGAVEPAQPSITRAIMVTCDKGSLFNAALVAKRDIDLKGNGVLTDSYDSSNPAKNTNGRYDPEKYTGDHGDVATNGGIESSVGVQNANIYGRVHTGPNCPVSLGPNGGVGTHAWQAGHSGIQPGYLLQDANFTFPDTSLPNTAGYLPPASGYAVDTTYNVTTSTTNATVPPATPPPSGVSTNINGTTTVSVYPTPPPPGLVTNTTQVTTSIWPGQLPGIQTNNMVVNNSPTVPLPVPPGTTTNTHYVSKTKDRPGEGKYVPGTLVQNGKFYSYTAIDGYNYSVKMYLYPTFTYSYSTFVYSWQVSQTNITYLTNYYDFILEGDTKYVASSLSGSALIKGPNAVLVLPNGLTGSENLKFLNGATLRVHAGGSEISVTGNNVLNPSGFAGSFVVFCAPTVKQVKFAGNGEFTGVIVAPEAALELKGGGNSSQDFCGSLMVDTVRMNGHFKFHYDEALGQFNGQGRWLISSWDEIY